MVAPANHPGTLHLSENLCRAAPLDHLAGRHIGLMLFSPDCRHFPKVWDAPPEIIGADWLRVGLGHSCVEGQELTT